MKKENYYFTMMKGLWEFYFVKPFESFRFSLLDSFLLMSFSIYIGVFCGVLFKNYVTVVDGSIFIVSAGFVAASLSYLAIESARELREKELERVDLEKMADFSVEVTKKQRTVFDLGSKIFDEIDLYLDILEEKDDEESIYLNSFDENDDDEVIEQLEKMEIVYSKKTSNKISKIFKQRSKFVDKINEVYDANNKLSVLYFKIESNHALDNVDITSLSTIFDNNFDDFKKSRRRVYKAIDKLYYDDIVTKEEISSFREFVKSQRKAFVYQEFPDQMLVYDEVVSMLRAPGLKVYKKSNRYLIVQNICFMICSFVIMVAFVNGFKLK